MVIVNGMVKNECIDINYKVIVGFLPSDSGSLNMLISVKMERKCIIFLWSGKEKWFNKWKSIWN